MNLFESYFITIFASYIIVGATFTDVIRYLKGSGFALPNLPSLPHVTVAGALATGTHGSGLQRVRNIICETRWKVRRPPIMFHNLNDLTC
jgi:hypothetical protein